MFGNLFKKKSELELLQDKYQLLLKKSFDASKINRTLSDKYQFEANEVAKKIDELSNNNNNS
tara:strand:+ start:525 stop:710 length:186 start_codon:yes stop_codon:yes gene_type:complete